MNRRKEKSIFVSLLGAEKIDRADNFLQQALEIVFSDFDRVPHCISHKPAI